jgi:hypothetical protein
LSKVNTGVGFRIVVVPAYSFRMEDRGDVLLPENGDPTMKHNPEDRSMNLRGYEYQELQLMLDHHSFSSFVPA